MMEDLSPFGLTEIEPGSFSLLSSQFEDYEEIFNECGYEGGGYDWAGVAKQIIRADAPDLQDRLKFDSEGSMFCAYGSDEAALKELGELMRDTFADVERLKVTIKAADPEWFD